MGLFSWLSGTSKSNPQPTGSSSPEYDNLIRGPGKFLLAVVGESHYQSDLREICGPPNEDGENKRVRAILIFEDTNPKDSLAVRVDVEGMTVGYLDRESARSFREAVDRAKLRENGLPIACNAVIRGGWDRGGEDRGSYGVWLDIPIEE
jgi:hypothetical protein